jgi:carbon monoxide dehydrogenase subunit G
MSPSIRLSEEIAAPRARVWEELADLGSHAEWMVDAADVDFGDGPRTGPGTRMKVATRVGPIRVTDVMTVVEWIEGSTIAVAHTGAVKGTGRFDLEEAGGGSRLTWTEELWFPWWLGGRVGGLLARPLLERIWRSNLARFSERLVSSP